MTTGEIPWLLVSLVQGAGIGVFFFGCLWLTVRYLPRYRHPGPIIALSLVGRVAVSVLAFYLIGRSGQWAYLIAALLGFVVTRIVMVRRLRPARKREEMDADNS
jgi:F1F0 ATPase subunit 2